MGPNYIFLCCSSIIFLGSANLDSIHAVDYSVENRVATSPGGITFNKQIGEEYARSTVEAATKFIWNLFRQNTHADRKNAQRVAIVIVQNLGSPNIPAATWGDEINLSADYIQQNGGDKRDFSGVVYHEMTHVWLWKGIGA
ncbi:hypothetical protein L6164_035727 [Bauhinia variegata]|uniref:Uncharacterized protein n=1 Tax=Bauhinia variegata TaxID=167791 RepID=A0ACB9KF01_BAUVA|nr:hypothetical protein L6164_035727 [Bauhinia variegata]